MYSKNTLHFFLKPNASILYVLYTENYFTVKILILRNIIHHLYNLVYYIVTKCFIFFHYFSNFTQRDRDNEKNRTRDRTTSSRDEKPRDEKPRESRDEKPRENRDEKPRDDKNRRSRSPRPSSSNTSGVYIYYFRIEFQF